MYALRKKYPKWAHRLNYHKKKRRRSKRKRRRTSKTETVTTLLLTQLLHQIMGTGNTIRPVARKHGDNVISGYRDGVSPEPLVTLKSRSWYRGEKAAADRPGGVGVGVAAAAHAGPRAPMPS